MDDDFPAAGLYTCPNCGKDVEVAPEAVARLVACPHCAWEFIVPSIDGATDLPEDLQAMEEERQRQEQVSNLRIRKLARGRSTTHRHRNWIISGMIVCAVAVLYLPLWGLRARVQGWGTWQLYASIPLSLASLMATVWLYRKARQLGEELDRQARDARKRHCRQCQQDLPDNTETCPHCGARIEPADFTQLSQAPEPPWKKLEQLSRPTDADPPPP